MALQFNADEIFEIAERIEQNGARFYRQAAENTSDERARQMLLKLADMEDDHEQTFAGMRAQLKPEEKQPAQFDPEDELVAYLHAFADGHVFDTKTDPAAALTGAETVAQILHQAIGMEKDSIVFYLGVRDIVPASGGRERIEAIIDEERSHIATLARELSDAKRA
jgi:rubrerythrin